MAEIIAFPQNTPQENRQKRKKPFAERMYIAASAIIGTEFPDRHGYRHD